MVRKQSQPINIRRRLLGLVADPTRVIPRLFLPGDKARLRLIVERVRSLSEDRVRDLLSRVMRDFAPRHRDIEAVFERHFEEAAEQLNNGRFKSPRRRLLAGAYFTAEYSLESVALFNPSIVPHPDQRGLDRGAVRFIMSLRACGEGHVSSIVFRTGTVDASNGITIDAVAQFAATERPVEDKLYERHPFSLKLTEMGAYHDIADAILNDLGAHFTLSALQRAVEAHRGRHHPMEMYQETVENMLWLAHSNYHLEFPSSRSLSERVIFPVTENECRGIEDARFVRFTDDDGQANYYATYTAYNGFTVLPQLIETADFRCFKIITLNGRCVQNKGMALFPRKIDGEYRMISRLDGGNLYLMTSDNLHFWNEASLLHWEAEPWEFVQVGNCGSPLETEQGWLLLTHGVGPMRQYCIGAALLDLHDPSRLIAHLSEPLIMPEDSERDGYVPNVVYSCGAMIHGDELIIPYAKSDTCTGIATVSLSELLAHLTERA